MGPTRSTHKPAHQGAQSKSKTGLPGVQKIKSAIRQTTRLLAKDKLAADVRVETERRLKSLQADLATAELVKKERTMAVKYHKVKFFERQKAYRKIKSTKRAILDESTNDKTRRKLEKKLLEQRIDLNYVLHFPKLKKYVSLFPAPPVGNEDPSSSKSASTSETDATRAEVRQWVRTAMEKGEMDAEPEMTIGAKTNGIDGVEWNSDSEGEHAVEHQAEKSDDTANEPTEDPHPKSKKVPKVKEKKKSKTSKKPDPAPLENLTLEGDDFFEI